MARMDFRQASTERLSGRPRHERWSGAAHGHKHRPNATHESLHLMRLSRCVVVAHRPTNLRAVPAARAGHQNIRRGRRGLLNRSAKEKRVTLQTSLVIDAEPAVVDAEVDDATADLELRADGEQRFAALRTVEREWF